MRTPEEIAQAILNKHSGTNVRDFSFRHALEAAVIMAQRERRTVDVGTVTTEPQFAPDDQYDYYFEQYCDLVNWGQRIDPEHPFGTVHLTSQVGETKRMNITYEQARHILAYLSEQNR